MTEIGKGLQPGVPEEVRAASISANAQIERERRNRISPGVVIMTEGDYHAALVRIFSKGAAYGRVEGTIDLQKQLSRESQLRLSAEQKACSLDHELREAQSRLTMTKQELAQVTRRFELYRQS
jgi:hypothetical protein